MISIAILTLKVNFNDDFYVKKTIIQFDTYKALAFDFQSVKFCKKIFIYDRRACRS